MFWCINICILTVFQRKLSGTEVNKSKNKRTLKLSNFFGDMIAVILPLASMMPFLMQPLQISILSFIIKLVNLEV